MTIALQLARLMGGDISINNLNIVDKGTTFGYIEATTSVIAAVHIPPATKRIIDLEPSQESLGLMSGKWLAQLAVGAVQLDPNRINEPSEQILLQHIVLEQVLQYKVDDFDCEEIVNLIHQTNTE